MSQQLPDNSDSQQPDANLTQQPDSSTPQNVVQGNQNRAVQGNDNQAVLGKSNTVNQGNNNWIISTLNVLLSQHLVTPVGNREPLRKWQFLLKICFQKLLLLLPGGGIAITLHFAVIQQWKVAFALLSITVFFTLIILVRKFIVELINRLSQKWEVGQQQLAVRLADAIWSELELWLWEFTSDFKAKYYKNLVYTYRTYRTQGLKTPGAFTPDLDKVFVPLQVTSKSPQQMSQALIQKQQTGGNLQIWDFLAEVHTRPVYKRLLVIAPPGYGKTTLLEHLTITYAQNTQRQKHQKAPKFIPVLLSLQKIKDEITSFHPPDLAQLIIKLLQTSEFGLKLDPPLSWFENKLKGGKCLVMLDGLDEVADRQQRTSVSQWVEAQMSKYPETTFILTSRLYGYLNAQLQQQPLSLEIQSFNLKQVEQFLHNWYLQNEIMRQARKEDVGVRTDAKRKANDLIERIKNHPPLAAMALNPLLLTMIATVHDNRGALPGSRVELYAEICEVLLVRRQQVKGIQDPVQLNPVQKQSVLQVLALQLMLQKTREFNLSIGEHIIQQKLSAVAGDKVRAINFLQHIEHVSGLLLEKKPEVYEFAHKSFQEYLTAMQLKEENNQQLLKNYINDPWWDETIRLYAATSDITDLILAALENPTVVSLSLAYDCLQECRDVAPPVRQQLEDTLEQGLESANPQIAFLAAQVKLSRRLNNLLRIDENLKIDTSYITFAEYQLFIDSNRTSQIPHFPNTSFIAENAKNDLLGISWQNALAFCNWLNFNLVLSNTKNDEDNPIYYYRLPTLSEAKNYFYQTYKNLKIWTIDGGYSGDKGICIVKERMPQNCIKLANYLAEGECQKAAYETVEILCKETTQEVESEFNVESIKKIPCSCLRTINQLWMQYSRGLYGWGVRESLEISVSTSGNQPYFWCLNTSRNAKEIFSNLVKKYHDCGIECLSPLFTFDVVTVNARGQEIQWELRQSEYYIENLGNTTLEMISIPAGKFPMGSPENEPERYSNEEPQHEVTVQSFFMSKYPITQAQWKAVVALPRVNRELNPNPSYFKGENRPVEQVSWHEAIEFCERLSKHSRKHYRLPSEAEWEYACRASTTTPFHFGDTVTPRFTNYASEYIYASSQREISRQQTTEVNYFKVANAFGLYDMHGNVWEWCADLWHDNYESAPTDGSVWITADNNSPYIILRGGSWSSDPRVCRSACRSSTNPDSRVNYIGFRIVACSTRN